LKALSTLVAGSAACSPAAAELPAGHLQLGEGVEVQRIGDVDDGAAGELVSIPRNDVVERFERHGQHDDVAGDRFVPVPGDVLDGRATGGQ